MARLRTYLMTLAAAAAAVAVIRHIRGAHSGRKGSGGILVGDARFYDAQSKLLLAPLHRRIAADVASSSPAGAHVLEVGCGPGHLSIRLAHRYGLDTTGVDLDPAMIGRARANVDRASDGDARRPSFVVGDVASLAFPDGSFDVVVSTLSMHHWADPIRGLAEIGRVLRPGGRVLVWDLRAGLLAFHRHAPDPLEHVERSGLQVVSAGPWRWPWRLNLTQRIELIRADEPARRRG